jgi:hypothetical protein
MWIEQDSVLTIRFDHFSSLGSDTGTIGVILKKVTFQNGDTLDCDTIFFRWSAGGTAIQKKSVSLPEKYGVDGISFFKRKNCRNQGCPSSTLQRVYIRLHLVRKAYHSETFP